LGVAISTVDGRFRIALRAGVGCQTSSTASQISTAKSSSVPVKLSGEYSSRTVGVGNGRDRGADRLGGAHRDRDDAGAIGLEDHAPLQGRGRVVEVHDRAPRALDRLEGPLDLLLARLRQHLDRDVVGDDVFLDDAAHEVEVGLRRGREADFDLAEADRDEAVPQPQLALRSHRLDQRLVAVAEVHAAPDRRRHERARRPLAIGQIDGRERSVAVRRQMAHGSAPCAGPVGAGFLFRSIEAGPKSAKPSPAGSAGEGFAFRSVRSLRARPLPPREGRGAR
jgi:hypothetical protein